MGGDTVKDISYGSVSDFETTTDENDCRVWAWCDCQIQDIHDISFGTSIDTYMEYCSKNKAVVFFHNLAFDGKFILDWLLKHGYTWVPMIGYRAFKAGIRVPDGAFSTLISDNGKFYSIEVKWMNRKTTVFYDSLKKLPMSVKAIAETFELKEGKGEIDYTAPRPVGYIPTYEETDYMRRDVQIVAEAMRQAIDEGMSRMTVASDSLNEYKKVIGKNSWDWWFPQLGIDCDEFIRESYRGGFTYVSPHFQNKIVGDGIVLDVNSLYPSVMYDELLPWGVPETLSGWPSPTEEFPLYIVRVTFTARLKAGHIPMIQLRNSPFYAQTEYQTDITEPVTMTVTSVDWELMNDQYDINLISVDCGMRFRGRVGMFKEYIDKWMDVKANSEGGKRAIAKLHLNSLYGKFATNPHVQSKKPVLDSDKVAYHNLEPEFRKPVYTAVASFITSYARNKTIRSAQRHYDRFIYADTDSLHMTGTEMPIDLDIHPTKLGAWKHESTFQKGKFIRAKAYCEIIDGTPHVHVAGMPASISDHLTFDDFCEGGVFHGKLVPRTVPGGVVLRDTTFTLE